MPDELAPNEPAMDERMPESLPGEEFRMLDDPVRGVVGSLDEMVHGVGGVFGGMDDHESGSAG